MVNLIFNYTSGRYLASVTNAKAIPRIGEKIRMSGVALKVVDVIHEYGNGGNNMVTLITILVE